MLVAEDNPVNQRVVERLLIGRGHDVVLAANGQEAVARYRDGVFDVVLMDVQMPVMGGFEATAAIRAHETIVGTRVPIIALTAHAMSGDRDRCLEAGMNGYLSKPIDRAKLFAVVEGEDDAPVAAPAATPAPPPEAETPAIDVPELLQRLGGDADLARDVVDLFRLDWPTSLARLRAALEAGDAGAVQRAAHSLKGAAGNLSAGPTTAAARDIEHLAEARDLAAAGAELPRLEREAARLFTALETS